MVDDIFVVVDAAVVVVVVSVVVVAVVDILVAADVEVSMSQVGLQIEREKGLILHACGS